MADPYRMFVRPEGDPGERGADLMERHGGPMARQAIEALRLRPSDSVLEIGFGPGIALQLLTEILMAGHVAGVDPSTVMHRRATRRNAGAMAAGRLDLLEATVEALPFEDRSFDAALAIDNLHFWKPAAAGLREIHRVLRPGSIFLCAFTPPSGGHTAGLPELLTRTGFEDVMTSAADVGSLVTARKPSGQLIGQLRHIRSDTPAEVP
ncbi:class I SAM-dependent methyltransferase [Sphingomonas sp. CFBP 8760]|uniref:class I SAM-dependent methyltransferase n=1 Tax=Sphingomonas sp. CFBP 8760 TaxID=2775282 RepID=UPI00177B3144|nr:class I SAM-dependent methyltransferase [Sphingomonas sp. CFBP 8760]MBD8548949.1 class I SAM-dependent methyltransferase [Sphingomonas sp. CFBP 8760]